MASAGPACGLAYLVRVMSVGSLLRLPDAEEIVCATSLAYGWLACSHVKDGRPGTEREPTNSRAFS